MKKQNPKDQTYYGGIALYNLMNKIETKPNK